MRDFLVDEGDWARRELYRGQSLWRAALAMARGRRDAKYLGAFAGYDSQRACDMSGVDYSEDCGVDLGLADEEEDFFEGCKDLGRKYHDRRKQRKAA